MISLALFQITVIPRRHEVPSFADIIKIEITFIKLSIKVEKITIMN